ncbi:MAG: PEGA domain-containing protein [Acidobacteria bacterium]|nr:PEGA domain-containing protein [Acidobacteriota bacterium]
MTRANAFLTLLLVGEFVAPIPAFAQQPFALLDGTPVKLRLNRNLSSADAKVGETADFEILEDVKVNSIVVASRGGVALATVTEAKPKGRMGKAGRLNVNIDHLRLVNGDKVALRAVKETQGGSNAGKMTGAIVATAIVFFPAAPLFLFVKGKDITIPKGTELTAYINGEVKLDPDKFQQAPGRPVSSVAAPASVVSPAVPKTPAASTKKLTNADIIELKSANFSDEVVIAKIKGSEGDYSLDTKDLLDLKKANVSDAIIHAMLEASKK